MTTVEAPNQGSRMVPHISADASTERPADELDRIPRSVPRSVITTFLADLGLDIRDIVALDPECTLRLGGTCITVTIYATNSTGTKYVDMATGHPAVHHITIPIVDDSKENR